MTIEITRPFGTPASDRPDALQQNGVQAQDQDATLLITGAEVALGTAAAPAVHRKERRWVAPLRRIFMAGEESRSTRRPDRSSMTCMERARMAREMERL
jgi:hypothetical protein